MLLLAFLAAQLITDADRLKTAMPAVELLSAQKLDGAFSPYFDCYMARVAESAGVDLASDGRTATMLKIAFDRCAAEREIAEKQASALVGENPTQAVAAYRRVATWGHLRAFFALRGDTKKFDAAWVRIASGTQPQSEEK